MKTPAVIASPFLMLLPGLLKKRLGQNFDVDALFQRVGIGPNLFATQEGYLTVEQLDKLVKQIYAVTKDPAFALHVAETVHPSQFGLLGELLISNRTLREVIAELMYYKDLAFPFVKVQLQEQKQIAIISAALSIPEQIDYKHVYNEFLIAVGVKMGSYLIGPGFVVKEVKFSHAQPAHLADYKAIFSCPLTFSHFQNEIIVAKKIINLPLRFEYKNYHDYLKAKAEVHIQAYRQKQSFSQQVMLFLEQGLLQGNLDIVQVAQHFKLSKRTLQRKLQQEKTSFDSLLLQAKCQLAVHLLQDAKLKMSEISYQLGFQKPSSFSAAFKRIQGISPSEYRKNLALAP